jgi:uncharacterized protein YndB with AHSA1/START domain
VDAVTPALAREDVLAVAGEGAPGRVTASFDADVPAESAWAALTDASVVARWFGTLTGDLRPGVPNRVEFGDGDFFDIDDVEAAIGSPTSTLGYSWRFMRIGPVNFVNWTVTASGPGVTVTVTDDDPDRTLEEATELREGWLDFMRRLRRFLTTGESTRYDWRRALDVATPLGQRPGRARERLLGPAAIGRWLPVAGGTLEESARLTIGDGLEPDELEIAALSFDGGDRVAFELRTPEWRSPTPCRLQVTPRGAGSLLSVSHVGWESVGAEEDDGLPQRRRFSRFWIATLERAHAVVEQSN